MHVFELWLLTLTFYTAADAAAGVSSADCRRGCFDKVKRGLLVGIISKNKRKIRQLFVPFETLRDSFTSVDASERRRRERTDRIYETKIEHVFITLILLRRQPNGMESLLRHSIQTVAELLRLRREVAGKQ